MIVIPSIELRRGLCVLPASEVTESGGGASLGDPIRVARGWANMGFPRIHLIDGDATGGTGSNASIVDDIIRDGALEVDVRDAAESSDHIERLIDAGAARVVVGPRALEEPDWLSGACELFPGLLVVSADVRERKVVTRGWVRSLLHDILDVVNDLNGLPLAGLLVSGSEAGASRTAMELNLIEDVVEGCDFPVFVVDGVASMNDLRALDHRGVSAAIVGRSLYDGTIDARAAAMEFDE
jgi:phosphoribosylformimino-5-aminoimidazole carboxamide ribotide isomerase